jgi:hypothetical protein
MDIGIRSKETRIHDLDKIRDDCPRTNLKSWAEPFDNELKELLKDIHHELTLTNNLKVTDNDKVFLKLDNSKLLKKLEELI